MILKLYSIFDGAAGAFIQPFSLSTDRMACRAFSDCANDPNHQFGKNPTDYTLFCIGEFDDNNGELKHFSPHINLGLAAVYVREHSLNRVVSGTAVIDTDKVE